MALAPEKTEREEKTITIKLNDFIQKNRMKLLLGLAAIIVIFAGAVIFITVNEKLTARAFSRLDEIERRYEALRFFIGGDDAEAASKQADIDTLIADIDVFTRKNSGFAAARAYTISAGIYEAQKKWPEAEIIWQAAAKAAEKTYLAPLCVYNAAVAAEEQGKTDAAIDLYTRAMDYGNSFPAAANAQFSVGRLEESRGNKDAALAAYNNLISRWPADPVWTNFAQSRIAVLSN